MKLCFVSQGQWSIDVLRGEISMAGGAEAQLAYLASSFANLGHEVDLIFGDGKSADPVCNIAGVRCINAFPSWQRPGSLSTFWYALRESSPDLLYARLPHDFLWLQGVFAKCSPHTTFVYAIAGDKQCNPWLPFEKMRFPFIHRAMCALGMRLADVVAVQHKVQEKMVKPFINGRLVLIPNLLRSVKCEPRRFEDTTIDAIWVSQIHPRKQLSIFLDIAEQLPEFRFVVVGGFGPEPNRRELEHRMQRLGNLRFEGLRRFEDVIQLLMSSKVLVNTSSWEGFPNTMLEAWSVGVPVVSLQIDPGGVISREDIGLVSKTPGQLAKDIMKFITEASLNQTMGKKGQDYVRRTHSIGEVCQAFEQAVPGFQVKHTASLDGIV